MFAGNYGQMRFATNPSYLGFKSWAVDYNSRYLNWQLLAGGLFVDNSGGSLSLPGSSVLEPTGSYSGDYAALLNAIGQAVSPHWLLANTGGGRTPAATQAASDGATTSSSPSRPRHTSRTGIPSSLVSRTT